jgi:uncharacterized membrane protein HdeD (DUF308 family)
MADIDDLFVSVVCSITCIAAFSLKCIYRLIAMAKASSVGSEPFQSSAVISSNHLHHSWAWFVALGVAFTVLGFGALMNVFLATLAAVFYIGLMMIVGAVAHVIAAFRVRKWDSAFLWLLSGMLYGVAGALLFYNPFVAASALTLLMALVMILAGCMRIFSGIHERPHNGWRWIVAAGVMTTLVGVLIALRWPVTAPWLLGLILAVDLLFQGAASLALGIALRHRGRPS